MWADTFAAVGVKSFWWGAQATVWALALARSSVEDLVEGRTVLRRMPTFTLAFLRVENLPFGACGPRVRTVTGASVRIKDSRKLANRTVRADTLAARLVEAL